MASVALRINLAMPPRSKALASAVESIASTSLRRSSRRSIPTSPSKSQAQASTSSAASSAIEPPPISASPRAKRPRVKAEPANDVEPTLRGSHGKQRVKEEVDEIAAKAESVDAPLSDTKPAATKKRRTKIQAEEEKEIFPPRPSPQLLLANGTHPHADRRGGGLFIGAHISSAGGVENALLNALRIGGNAFSCFVRPKMQWASNPIPDTSIESFKHRIAQHGFMPRLRRSRRRTVLRQRR